MTKDHTDRIRQSINGKASKFPFFSGRESGLDKIIRRKELLFLMAT
jgi:hypothetical protein